MEALSQIDIGKRIALLRKSKGYSQEELSIILDLSRSSLTQIELGKRNISVLELIKIADSFSMSIDKLLADSFTIEDVELSAEDNEDSDFRISTPELKIDKFKEVLLYILEKCAGKPNVGETMLYKLLYFSDFNYYEIYEEHLTGAEYRKLAYGPVPQKWTSIIQKMMANKMIERFKSEYQGSSQIRYIPLVKANLANLKASEKDVIDRVIDQYSDWSSDAITIYAHKDMPWVASKEGEIIDYELAFYREAPFSVRIYGSDF